MNCRQAYLWMLSADAAEGPLPAGLRSHLELCGKCSRRRRRLLRLTCEVRLAAPLTDNAAARARIVAALPDLPPAIPSDGLRRPLAKPRPVRIVLGAAAAAAVLILVILSGAFAFLRRGAAGNAPTVASAPPPPPVIKPDNEDLLSRVVERDLVLAKADGAEEQLTALTAMAGDLWAEAERRVHQAGRFDLPLLAGLYERVVGRGVVGRVLALDADRRGDVLPAVVRQLRDAADDCDRLAAETPEAKPDLDRLSSASRGAVLALDGGGPAPAVPLDVSSTQDAQSDKLLADLVGHGLCMAEQDDPLERADSGAAVVDTLTQAIVNSSDPSDADAMAKLGGYVAQFQSEAVKDNLDQVAVDDLDRQGQADLDRVRQRSVAAMGLLEKTAQQAPEAAKPGLVRALEAAQGKDAPKDKPPLPRQNKGKPPKKKRKPKG